MSPTLATALVNWSELWRIVLAALVGGTGVAIVFGVLLIALSRGTTATRPAARLGFSTLSGLCGVFVAAVAVLGVYAMTQKKAAAKPAPRADVVNPAGPAPHVDAHIGRR